MSERDTFVSLTQGNASQRLLNLIATANFNMIDQNQTAPALLEGWLDWATA